MRRSVDEAYARYRMVAEGERSRVYPALARVPAGLFGICAVGTSGSVDAAGDAGHGFAVMSVAKPFVFALVCQALGPEELRRRVGVNATGLAFNSAAAVERGADGRTNPMVNAGAIATTSLAPGGTAGARWSFVEEGLARFAGRALALDEEVYASASATNHRNRAIANLLQDRGRLWCDPAEAVDLYTRQSSLRVSATELAVMGATLAVMTTAGMYEASGDWLYDVGVPGKSGIGGGIVVVSPGKGALATFAPPLDAYGNSVKGQLAARFLSRRLGLSLFASEPEA
ncbi:MAG: glutaminase [Actinomycetia bacterium]|nr:glutaminase [Actinomycetes bacterium]